MDLSNAKFHLVASLSSAQDSLKRAKSLISLAEKNQPDANTLAACATILLSAALEQAVKTRLSEAAETIAIEDDVDSFHTNPARYLDINVSSRIRVRSLPLVLTGGRFRLDPSHKITKILEELIETRNNLAHVEELAVRLIGPSDQVKIEDSKLTVSFTARPNPWGMVKLERVKTFQMAVDVYFDEVLFPKSGEITGGTIVVSVSQLEH